MSATQDPASSRSQTALVTGASGGIGYEFAKLFARDGYNLVLVARSTEKLHDIAKELRAAHKVDVMVVAADLSQAKTPTEVFAATSQAGIDVDVLVNNAGVGQWGEYQDLDLDEELGQIQLNVNSLSHLTKLYARAMIDRRRGRILNVASTAAFQPGPLMSVYYATKAYVLSYSLALANEFKDKGVTVTCLCPGPTPTGFQGRAHMQVSKLMKAAFMDVKVVVDVGYAALMKGKPLAIPGVFNWITSQAVRLLPRAFSTSLARRVQESRGR